jgi:hypothetical protein
MNNKDLYYDFNKTQKKNNNIIEENTNKLNYVYRFKIALYCIILFIILSNKNTYKIIDIIVKMFRKDTNDIIDDNGNPLILGIGINALIFALIIIFVK